MATVVVGTNSWVTVAEADTYFDEKFGCALWATLTANTKAQLLISAYRWIMQQALFSISPTSTAAIVKQAQMEAAWYLYNHSESHQKHQALYAQGVREFDIGEFSEKLAMPDFPQFITDMLKDSVTGNANFFPHIERSYEEED